MDEMIKQIEAKLGHSVYVGRIAGLSGTWASVDDDRINARHQHPGETEEAAVLSLFCWVMK